MKLKITSFKTDQEKQDHLTSRSTRDLKLQFRRNLKVVTALERENISVRRILVFRGVDMKVLSPIDDNENMSRLINDSRNITIEP